MALLRFYLITASIELEKKHSVKISLYILQNQGLEYGATDTTQKTQTTVESYFLIFNYRSNKLGLTGSNGTQKCKKSDYLII